MRWWTRTIFTIACAVAAGVILALVAEAIYAIATASTFLGDSDTGDTVAGFSLCLGIALGTAFGIVWRREWIQPPKWHWQAVADESPQQRLQESLSTKDNGL
ncbi:MAG TPA: hypothetical protein VFJ98_07345 [Mycobacteriales bacterium]|nr:hypothetical protein [Mycobacteriales bacterium]